MGSVLQTGRRAVRVGEGDTLGDLAGRRDRFLFSGQDSGGSIAILQHILPPRTLAGPVHRHSREDEYSFVLEGRVGALLGDIELVAEPGDLIFKPRDEWHTFWNAGDTTARVLEIITPGGLEALFREMHALGAELTPEALVGLAGRYGCGVDFEATAPLIEKHRLVF
jgi:quercetin dioxygenase-like cupin family protein